MGRAGLISTLIEIGSAPKCRAARRYDRSEPRPPLRGVHVVGFDERVLKRVLLRCKRVSLCRTSGDRSRR